MLQTRGKGNYTLYSYHIIYHSSSHLLSPQNTKRGQERSPILKGFKVPLLPRFKSKPSFSSTRSLFVIYGQLHLRLRELIQRESVRGRVYTCSAPQPPSASRIFCGGSILGMNSSTTYTKPIIPMTVPKTMSMVLCSSRMEPQKM